MNANEKRFAHLYSCLASLKLKTETERKSHKRESVAEQLSSTDDEQMAINSATNVTARIIRRDFFGARTKIMLLRASLLAEFAAICRQSFSTCT